MSLSIPNTFAAGQTIKSALMNGNFSTIQTYINGANLTAANLVSGAIGASGNTDLNSGIVDGTTLQMASNQISIASGGVTATQVASGAITTVKIADGAVTQVKRGALPIAQSASCSTFTTTSSSPTAVTNLSVNLTTSGRPAYITLLPDGTGNTSLLNGQSGGSAKVYFYRNAGVGNALIAQFTGADGVILPPSAFNFIDTAIAGGTYTYSCFVSIGGGDTMSVSYCILTAYEL